MRRLSIMLLVLVLPILASRAAHAQYATADTLQAVTPGLVYREFSRIIPTTDSLYRVTDPDATFVGEPHNTPSLFLPNPELPLTVSDLDGAIKAVAVLDVWGGHVGTIGKQFRFNGNDWIDIPSIANTPTSPECYTHQYSIEVEVPLEDLVTGTNILEGTSGGQTCYDFGWGQWGWYGIILRVFYDPAVKNGPTGIITSPVNGGALGESAVFSALANSEAGIERIEYVGYYDGYDVDGDGLFTEWQQSYHRLRNDPVMMPRNHIGTSTVAPFQVTWDTSWIPDQPAGSIEVVARIKDGDGLWYVTERVTGLSLNRPGIKVALYKPTNVAQNYWVRVGRTKSSNFTIPAGDDLGTAEAAQLHVVTWNGLSGQAEPGQEHWTRVNGWTTPVFGEDHRFAYDLVTVPTGVLQSGSNTVSFYSETTHHGNEILWPGPGVTVRYVDYTEVPASVITQPSDAYALEGATATFAIEAVGDAPVAFQWQRNGVDIPGALGTSYTTPVLSLLDDGAVFRCAVDNAFGSDVSSEATLTVLGPGPRNSNGQIVLYDFGEGAGNTVNDVSGVGTPLDLFIADPGAVDWLPGALSVSGSTVIASPGGAAKINDAVRTGNEITIEAWVKPANLTQNGPARIVTLSSGTASRNATLGQGVYGEASDAYEVRLRSTDTDLNGTPGVATAGGTLTTELTHVVFTRNGAGLTRIYLDGVERAVGQATGSLSNWDLNYGLGLANELTGDRPWLGELHLVAVFDRALPHVDVLQNYAAGPDAGQGEAINVTVSSAQDFGVPVSLLALPDGSGSPLSAARSWSGTPGVAAVEIDATIGVRLLDAMGDPVVGFPAEKITVGSTEGGWIQCEGLPLTADGPTDAAGFTTISGALAGGGTSGPGELLQVIVDDPRVGTTSYPGGLAGLAYSVNSPDISGDLAVNLVDVTDFSNIFFGNGNAFAADYVRDGVVNLSDLPVLGEGIGVMCPPGTATADGGARPPETTSAGTVAVVFDAAGKSRARNLTPGEQIDVFAVLRGSLADRGIQAFDLRIRTSENVVVHHQEFAGEGINLATGDGFIVGYGGLRKAQGSGVLTLVRLRVSVSDEEPAYFWAESDAGLPVVATGGRIFSVPTEARDADQPVASLNDEAFAADPGEVPGPDLSLGVFPNPFNPQTIIRFSLPVGGPVDLRVYDARGQVVTTLLVGILPAGEHLVRWNGTDSRGRQVASGLYFSRLTTDAGALLEKMMLVR